MQDFRDQPYAAYEPPFPRRKKRSVFFWLMIWIPVGVVGGSLLLVAAGALFMLTARDEPLTAEDRQHLPDIELLAELTDDFAPDENDATVTKMRYIDGSYDIEYEYDSPDDFFAPYIYYCLTVEPNHGDAMTTYGLSWQATKIGMWGEDAEIEIVERNDLFKWGDASRFAIIKADGAPTGNIFVARSGRIVVDMIISGIYFDTPGGFGSLMNPTLENIKRDLP